jgi:hypothetical protein
MKLILEPIFVALGKLGGGETDDTTVDLLIQPSGCKSHLIKAERLGCGGFSVQSPPFLKSKRRFRIRQIIGGSARSLHEVSHARRNGTQDLGRVTASF